MTEESLITNADMHEFRFLMLLCLCTSEKKNPFPASGAFLLGFHSFIMYSLYNIIETICEGNIVPSHDLVLIKGNEYVEGLKTFWDGISAKPRDILVL